MAYGLNGTSSLTSSKCRCWICARQAKSGAGHGRTSQARVSGQVPGVDRIVRLGTTVVFGVRREGATEGALKLQKAGV
jgi:hypothetical protein